MSPDILPSSIPVDLVTVGIAEYPKLNSIELLPARECCTAVADVLTAYGVSARDWSSKTSTKGAKQAIEKKLGQWSQERGVGSILYWVGHGEQAGNHYHVLLGNAEAPILPNHVLSEDDFVEYLRRKSSQDFDHPDDWVLLILDTCSSGVGAWNIYKKLAVGGTPAKNVGIVGTSNGPAPTSAGHFPELFKAKIAGFTPSDDHVSLRELMRRLEDAYEDGIEAEKRIHANFSPDARIAHPHGGAGIQAPQDVYAELDRVLRDAPSHIRNHFYAKAQGAEAGQIEWHFSGRRSERKQIVEWVTNARSGMLVLTGSAGSGKSAVLGMVLAASDPRLVDALEELGGPPVMDFLCPPPGIFTAVTHLSGRTIGDATAQLSSQLGQSPTTSPGNLIQNLRATSPVTILADALDEARDPYPIASLLRGLAALENVKVLVGTRQSLHEDPDHPVPPDQTVLEVLGASRDSNTRVLHLARDAGDIADYVYDRLRQNLPEGIPNRNATINRLTRAIAAADQPFLFARLAAYEAVIEPKWQDPDTDLAELLSHGHTGIFDRAVARIRAASPRVEALLRSLAYAQGNGYPRTGGIWAIAANALLHDRSRLTDDDIDQALRTAAPYIMLDSEFGVSTYRLAHRTYAERYFQLDGREAG
ncbi:ATP-binding protein [Arthrobacter sp. MA-N2]|uniref:ATP-binding protein n=1 Tax=Arthrobacter sp. MA-N2 TaxID=1101188 RepID=UPI000484357E|nr:ATP-binding protein [Arthrobacter sp. MA-N2]